MRVADIEFINCDNAEKTGVGTTLVTNDTLVFFNLHGINDKELEEILNYKSFTYRSWKEGKKTIYFVFKYGYGTDSKVIYCSAGFSSILIRLLQNKYNYTINGKELYRAKEISRLPQMKNSLWDFQRDAVEKWIENGCYGLLVCPTASGKSFIGISIIKKMNVRTIILCHTSDLLINVWFNYLIDQFGEEIKDRIGIIGGGLTNKDRKMMRIIDNDFNANIKKDIVIATSQSLLAGNKLSELGKEHFGLMITDECLPYDTLINTSKGVYKIGELYKWYLNDNMKNDVLDMTTKSLDFNRTIITNKHFIPKKTSFKKMYEIELINGIKFKASENHKCLTCYDKGLIKYEEIKNIKNIGYLNKKSEKIEFANVINKHHISNEQGYDLEILTDNNDNNHNYFIKNEVNVHNCHHYSAEQFKKVSSAVRSMYRLGLSATVHRNDGLSPIFYALLGDVRYRIGIKELAKKGLLVEPIFYSIIIEDIEACNKIANCKYKLLEYSRYVKKVSGSSELKFRYILGLCQSLQSKGRKFMLYTDFVNKSGIDEDGVFNAESVYTRNDYVKSLLELKIKVIGISSEMSGLERQSIFNKLGKNELDGIVFGSLGNEGINIPAVDSIITCNATASNIRFAQRCGRSMRLYKNKKNCFIYEVLLNVEKELKWSDDNFFEYKEQGFKKEKIYVNNDGYQIKKEITN